MKLFTKNYLSFFVMMLLSASLVLTTSCEKDDDTDPIVGSWELEKLDMTVGGETQTVNAATYGMEITAEFKDDGTFTTTSNFDGDTETDSGTWTRVDDNNVEVTVDGETDTLTKEGEYYVSEVEEDGMTMKMYFKKV